MTDEEGLTPHMGDLYEIPARLYYQLGDLDNAVRYLEKSMEQVEGWGVPGPEDLGRMQMLRNIMARIREEKAELKRAR